MSNYVPQRGMAAAVQISDAGNPYPPLHGTGYLAGTLTDDGSPVVGTVRALWRPPGSTLLESVVGGTTQSAANGTWQISDLNPDLEFVVVAEKADRNDVIAIGFTPRNPPRFSETGITVPVGVPLDYALPIIGGVGEVTATLASGTPPSGVSYADGTLSGTWPTGSTGSYPLTFDLTDDNETTSVTLTLDLVLLPITLTAMDTVPDLLAAGEAMTPVRFRITGGEKPYSLTTSAGSLPTGTTISPVDSDTFEWSGTPSAGDYSFTLQASGVRGTPDTIGASVLVGDSHKYWRINVSATNGHCSANEVEFRTRAGGTPLAGTAISSGHYPNFSGSTFYAENAFDGVTNDDHQPWASQSSTSGYIGLEFSEREIVTEVAIWPRGTPPQAFKDFAIQWSDDGSSWTTVHAESGVTSWDYSGYTPNIYSGW